MESSCLDNGAERRSIKKNVCVQNERESEEADAAEEG